jgi:hypothetical protein
MFELERELRKKAYDAEDFVRSAAAAKKKKEENHVFTQD